MKFNVGSIYMDAEGCFLVCVREGGEFLAFGGARIIELDSPGVAQPLVEAITNDGEILIDRVPYINNSNILED